MEQSLRQGQSVVAALGGVASATLGACWRLNLWAERAISLRLLNLDLSLDTLSLLELTCLRLSKLLPALFLGHLLAGWQGILLDRWLEGVVLIELLLGLCDDLLGLRHSGSTLLLHLGIDCRLHVVTSRGWRLGRPVEATLLPITRQPVSAGGVRATAFLSLKLFLTLIGETVLASPESSVVVHLPLNLLVRVVGKVPLNLLDAGRKVLNRTLVSVLRVAAILT